MLDACGEVQRISAADWRESAISRAAIEPFLPAMDVHWRSGEKWLVWVPATAEEGMERSLSDYEAAAIASVANGVHFVVVTTSHLSLVDQADLDRAIDVRRRRRVGLADPLEVTSDDLAVEALDQRLLRAFALMLDEAPSTKVCRRLGLQLSTQLEVLSSGEADENATDEVCEWLEVPA